MADRPAGDRTEQPTPERLKKARGEGQVAQSQEVSSAIILGALLMAFFLMSEWLVGQLSMQVREGLSFQLPGSMEVEAYGELFRQKGIECMLLVAPFFAVMAVASIISNALVGGVVFAPKALKVKFSAISPIQGFKNLFSMKSLVKLVISIAKLTVLLLVAWYYLEARLDTIIGLQWTTAAGTLAVIGQLLLGLGGRIAASLIGIAAADMLYQKWNYTKQMRMTRQEIKEEHKEHELSPEVRSRIRAVQYAMSRKRAIQEVPTADVVVTNPTHYAVALRYEAGEMAAPQVVAKGADLLCQKIKEIAKEHHVPIIEKPELARALYKTVEPGQNVPESLFMAVAEVMAMIYRLGKNRRNRRRNNRT